MPASFVPEVVRNKALASGADDWLEQLPTLIADLQRDWSITVGRPYDQGTEAFVAEATLEDGTLAVLKLLIPRDDIPVAREATVLRLASGEGCATLYRSDLDRNALLLERLGPSMYDLQLPIEQRHAILCDAARRLWRPAPDCGLPTGAEQGRWLIGYITRTWEVLDHPCSEQAVDYALACAERRVVAHDDERAVVIHGDVHQWNALQSLDPSKGFKLIDPDGLLAEPEYDLGILMREDPRELLEGDPYDRARSLAARTGLDPVAIWEWGAVERVSTGLLAVSIGLQPVGDQMLGAAEAVANTPPA